MIRSEELGEIWAIVASTARTTRRTLSPEPSGTVSKVAEFSPISVSMPASAEFLHGANPQDYGRLRHLDAGHLVASEASPSLIQPSGSCDLSMGALIDQSELHRRLPGLWQSACQTFTARLLDQINSHC
jgi:hypothetical protein